MKIILTIVLLTGLLAILSCDNNIKSDTANSQHMIVTVDTMKEVLDAFNRHDLDAIMEYFSDDCSFDFPRGPEPWGQRFVGKAQVREGLASRFKSIPDVHYSDDRHFVLLMAPREFQSGRLQEQQLQELN
jgi:hypothetical protein